MDFIYQYPETTGPEGDMLDAGSIVDVATALDRTGWHGLSFTEHPAPGSRWLEAGGHQSIDPFVALGHAAAVTHRIKLLTYLAVVPYRNPLLLAKTAATVDKLSNGRFVLGVGTGYLKGEFRALGVDFDERNTVFDEALDVMKLHWSGQPFDYEGSGFSARSIQAQPTPVQQPIPIWIGGNAKITRRRVAERAQGWMPLGGSAELLQTARTPSVGSIDELGTKIAEVRELAGDRGAELDFVFHYTGAGFDIDPAAAAEEHREAMARLEAIGITNLVISGPSARSATEGLEWIESVASTYLH